VSKKFTNPIRYLGDFHDFIRGLYFLRRGVTKYEFSKLMSVDRSAAYSRLEGWVRAGVVEKRGDKYYLVHGTIVIEGFGEIEVNDSSIVVRINPIPKFVHTARFKPDSVRVYVRRK